ncbi:MAG TPA: glucose-6-phosphate isomerase [Acidimicrobiia bacterium]|nr:glucose-6-phosphate isomerase [Acidimicrobiia bacterium]
MSEDAAFTTATAEQLGRLARADAVRRLWARDHALWQESPAEVADRLGWLDSPDDMLHRIGELESFAIGLASNGFTHVVLMGMGGSSLFPEVAVRTWGDGAGALRVVILDTTDPAAIRRVTNQLPLDTTFFIAASKSGTTVETRSQLAYFWDLVGRAEQFGAITDPGGPLASLARDRSFHAVFENRPDIGGRYSALSHFGLVPAALVGLELEELLRRALDMVDACRDLTDANPGAVLAAQMAAGVASGRDKLTLRLAPSVAAFGAWIEQLIAESTGKRGTGIIPIDGEPERHATAYADDRLFVGLGVPVDVPHHPTLRFPLDDPYDLGGEVVRWEVATALVGHLLGVNPFDQPDVKAAKDATDAVLASGIPAVGEEDPAVLLAAMAPGDYLAVQAFVDPEGDLIHEIQAAAHRIGSERGVAVTVGLGPRYLHSTGQLHKGGPPIGVFLQVVQPDAEDLAIPGAGYSFSDLKRAQAAGDLRALQARGLRAARVSAEALVTTAFE